MRIHVVAGSVLLASAALFGQEFRGTFSGLVTDAQGAAVPGVKITAAEVANNNKSETVSSRTGEYTIPFLPPGEYRITAESPGFKTYKREGLTLSTGEHPVVDIKLEVGETSQSVVVTAETAMIESANASVGQVISTLEVENIPINGRTPLMLSRLAMGVTGTNEPGPVRPFDNGAVSSFSIAGAPGGSNELLLNGVPDAGFSKQLAYSPPQDAVQEVSVHAFESDAAYGHTGGGVANHITKSGTNGFHGSLYEFNQISKLDANLFFSNKLGVSRAITNYNQYGITAGGPVLIPKVFNGRNRVFWFFALEKLHDSDPANTVVEGGSTATSVPTAAERTGDFSALLKLGAAYTLYDPNTGTVSTTHVARTPMPGNVIPTSRLNKIALNYLQYYPMPNNAGLPNGENNFGITVADSDRYDNEMGRVDVSFSDRSKLSYDFRHSYRIQNKNLYFSNPAFGDYLSRENWGTAADEVYTISPTLILDVRANWTRFHEANASPADGIDPGSLGFPSYLKGNSQFVGIPYLQFAAGCSANALGFQCIGMAGDNSTPYDVFQLFGSVSKTRGNHSFKAGADIRDYRESTFAHGNSAGTFTFNSNWVNGPLNNATAPPFGGDFAAFLLGLPSSGSFDLNAHSSTRSAYYAFFAQDDWRVRNNLTLNLGLRWERETPTVERFNRAVNGFDPKAVNSVSAAAAAAYGKNPSAALPVSQFSALGGLTFTGASNPDINRQTAGFFSPRVGVAWSPARWANTVLRGGIGIFVAPTGINGGQTLNQEGFSQTTQFTATNDNYLTPANTLSDPFPSGILSPVGSAGAAGTFVGQGITIFNPKVRDAYSIRWNIGVQRQLPGQVVLEVAYIGSHAVHLPFSTQLDYIPRRYLSASPARDATVVNLLTGTVPNPFQGLLPNSTSANGSTVALSQLLTPFPQYPFPSPPQSTSNGLVQQYTNAGESYYNSLNVRVQKRFTHGLTLIQNFAYSSQVDRVSYLNDSDGAPEKRVGTDSRPLREVVAASYDLPFGRGRRFNPGRRVFDWIAGDWSASGAVTFQSGPPLSWGNVIYLEGPLNYNAHDPNGPTFDLTRFNIVSSQQLADNIRTFDSQFNNLRRDPTKNADLSMLKRIALRENMYLQLRFESFNLTNRVTFGAPNLSPTNSSFGLITTQANTPRRIQLGARLVW